MMTDPWLTSIVKIQPLLYILKKNEKQVSKAKFEIRSYCVVGRHRSRTLSIEGQRTKTVQKRIIVKCTM